MIGRNDKYEAAIDHIHALEQSNQYAEAKMECETLLEGELKHRCANAAFWITFADIEKAGLGCAFHRLENRIVG